MKVPFIKIGSGDTNNYGLVEHIAQTSIPVILSTGLCWPVLQWKWSIAVSLGTPQIIPLCKITVVSHLVVFTVIPHFVCCKWVDLIFPAVLTPPVDMVTTGSWMISNQKVIQEVNPTRWELHTTKLYSLAE